MFWRIAIGIAGTEVGAQDLHEQTGLSTGTVADNDELATNLRHGIEFWGIVRGGERMVAGRGVGRGRQRCGSEECWSVAGEGRCTCFRTAGQCTRLAQPRGWCGCDWLEGCGPAREREAEDDCAVNALGRYCGPAGKLSVGLLQASAADKGRWLARRRKQSHGVAAGHFC